MVQTSRQKVLVSLVLFLALKAVFNSILSFMQTAMLSNILATLVMVFLIAEENARPREKRVWKYRRQGAFLQQHLLQEYSDKMFREWLKVDKTTYFFLC
jgi:hypothetical protein